MARTAANHFERAFEAWLLDNRVEFVGVDQHKRAHFTRNKIKSFDFLIYPRSGDPAAVIAEVKGRKFSGAAATGLKSVPSWVMMDDVRGLLQWEEIFGSGYRAVFVFIYELARPDADTDGREAFTFEGRRYFGLCVRLDDYRRCMRQRSRKWQTMHLPAADLRTYSFNLSALRLL